MPDNIERTNFALLRHLSWRARDAEQFFRSRFEYNHLHLWTETPPRYVVIRATYTWNRYTCHVYRYVN